MSSSNVSRASFSSFRTSSPAPSAYNNPRFGKPGPRPGYRALVEIPTQVLECFSQTFHDSETVILFLPMSCSRLYLKSPSAQPSNPELERHGWKITHRLQESLPTGSQIGGCALVIQSKDATSLGPETFIWLSASGFLTYAAGWRFPLGTPNELPFVCCEVATGQCWVSSKQDYVHHAESKMDGTETSEAPYQQQQEVCVIIEARIDTEKTMSGTTKPSQSNKRTSNEVHVFLPLPHRNGAGYDFIAHEFDNFKAVDISVLGGTHSVCQEWLIKFAGENLKCAIPRHDSEPAAYLSKPTVSVSTESRSSTFLSDSTSHETRPGRLLVARSAPTWPIESRTPPTSSFSHPRIEAQDSHSQTPGQFDHRELLVFEQCRVFQEPDTASISSLDDVPEISLRTPDDTYELRNTGVEEMCLHHLTIDIRNPAPEKSALADDEAMNTTERPKRRRNEAWKKNKKGYAKSLKKAKSRASKLSAACSNASSMVVSDSEV